MRFWHQLVELLGFRDHQNCGEANVWHVLCRISGPGTEMRHITMSRYVITQLKNVQKRLVDFATAYIHTDKHPNFS